MTNPVLIRGGVAYPITDAQMALARAHKPIGPVAGLDASARPPVAAAPSAPVAPPTPPTKPDGRALSRANMLAQIGCQYGDDARRGAETVATDAFRRGGMDRRAAAPDDAAPAAPRASTGREKGPDGLTMGQRSMLGAIERAEGKAVRAAAEARLGVRAA